MNVSALLLEAALFFFAAWAFSSFEIKLTTMIGIVLAVAGGMLARLANLDLLFWGWVIILVLIWVRLLAYWLGQRLRKTLAS